MHVLLVVAWIEGGSGCRYASGVLLYVGAWRWHLLGSVWCGSDSAFVRECGKGRGAGRGAGLLAGIVGSSAL